MRLPLLRQCIGLMQTLLEVLQKTKSYFESKGLDNPRLNAELIFAHVLKCKRLNLYLEFERPLPEAILQQLRPLVGERGRRVPLQYVLGSTPFHEITLKCDRRALIPRPETEELVNLVLNLPDFKAQPPANIADLGTGTGAIALALAKAWTESKVDAVDASGDALALARENAADNGLLQQVTFHQGSWFEALPNNKTFDLIVSNPPYLTEEEWATAEPEVRDHEPRAALVAANEGLADLEHLLRHAPRHLKPGGLIALETGIEHHEALTRIAQESGYARSEGHLDQHQRPRFFLAWTRGA